MKILISIQPQHLANILNGIKILELRKSMPKCDLPCTVVMYCSKKGRPLVYGSPCPSYINDKYIQTYNIGKTEADKVFGNLQGKVVAEFTLNKIDKFTAEFTEDAYEDIRLYTKNDYAEYEDELWDEEIITSNEAEDPSNCFLCEQSCLSYEEIKKYVGLNFHEKPFYGWHIDDLVIYDKPKELSEFSTLTKCNSHIAKSKLCDCCCLCSNFCKTKPKKLTRPPQSWCYVEEV